MALYEDTHYNKATVAAEAAFTQISEFIIQHGGTVRDEAEDELLAKVAEVFHEEKPRFWGSLFSGNGRFGSRGLSARQSVGDNPLPSAKWSPITSRVRTSYPSAHVESTLMPRQRTCFERGLNVSGKGRSGRRCRSSRVGSVPRSQAALSEPRTTRRSGDGASDLGVPFVALSLRAFGRTSRLIPRLRPFRPAEVSRGRAWGGREVRWPNRR